MSKPVPFDPLALDAPSAEHLPAVSVAVAPGAIAAEWTGEDEWDVEQEDELDALAEGAVPGPGGAATGPLPRSTRPLAIEFAEVPPEEPSEAGPATLPLAERVRRQSGQLLEICLDRPPTAIAGRQPIPLPPRYTWIASLGEGGQGRVDLVFDRDLGRSVALKTLHGHRNQSAHVLDFYREARVTGQLEHPHIIPILDAGQLPDGRLYYTMRRMPGESLHNVLYRLRRGDHDVVRRFSMHSLVQVLERAAHGVGFAHARGVIHRDIKPANVLLGNHGEVLVVDWGIARVVSGHGVETSGPPRLWSRKGEERRERVRGSPPYMAPEQVKHPDQVTAAADVFCLGVILYEILCRVPPFGGQSVEETVEALCHERPVPPRERAPEYAIPADLEEICLRCLEKFPGHRYADANELALALADSLGGGRRRENAVRRLREAEGQHVRYRTLAARATEQGPLVSDRPVGSRSDAAARDAAVVERSRAESALRARDGVFSEAVWGLQRALADEPELRDAKSRLAEIYAIRLQEAERLGAEREVHLFRAQLRAYDDGRWARWLRTGASLELKTQPEGLPLHLYRLAEDREGLLAVERIEGLGPWSLPPGRYALALPDAGEDVVVQAQFGGTDADAPLLLAGEMDDDDGGAVASPEREAVRRTVPRWTYPLRLDRDERQAHTLDFRWAGEAGERFAYVPGGPARLGGDARAAGSGPERLVDLPAYAIARHAVTVGAWARFLTILEESDPIEARRRTPPNFRDQRAQGDTRPVTFVSLDDAQAYCRWLCEATGLVLRLPTADEWQKAARGGDARAWPWGDRWDDLACGSLSACDPAGPPPEVGAFARDRSPFGMEDGAGGVWEWTGSDDGGNRTISVGGSWISEPDACRCAVRRALRPETRLAFLGFRVVRAFE